MVPARVTRWLVFTVAVGVLPFGFAALSALSHGERTSLASILGGGDLYLLTSALAAAAVGDLLAVDPACHPFLRLLVGGLAVLLSPLSCLLHADALAARTPGAAPHLDRGFVATASLVLFALVVAVGATSLWIRESACSTRSRSP